MKARVSRAFVAVVLLMLGAVQAGSAQSRGEIEKLRKEIEQLKATQQAMQKEIQQLKQQQQPAAAKAPSPVENPVNVYFDISGDPVKGSNEARVTVVEFSEFQCPFCARHVRDTIPQLEKEYISTGKVKYVFRNFPLEMHPLAFKASEAAACAGEQGKFWEMHDRLFAHQDQLQPEKLPVHAQELGLDMPKFQQCFTSGKYAADINKSVAEAKKAGATATPTFFIAVSQPNDPKVKAVKGITGAKRFEVFKAALDGLLAPPSNAVNPLGR